MSSQIFSVCVDRTRGIRMKNKFAAAIGSDDLTACVQAGKREQKGRYHTKTACVRKYTDIKLAVTGIGLGGKLKSAALITLNMGRDKSGPSRIR